MNTRVLCARVAAEGVVRSMSRGCEVLDDTEEGCTADVHFDTCWTKCSTDLCNDGDGYPDQSGAIRAFSCL